MNLEKKLIEGVKANNLDAVKEAVEGGASVNTLYSEFNTVLTESVSNRYIAIATYLLEKGADPVASGQKANWKAMEYAAHNGSVEMIDLLTRYGAKATDLAISLAEGKHHAIAASLLYSLYREQNNLVPVVKEGWHQLGEQHVAHTETLLSAGYRLTEMFNFATRRYTQLAQNLETKAESQTVRFFDEFIDKSPLEQARVQLNALGGAVEASAIYADVSKPKPKNLTHAS